jgi:hypothetical protein
MMKEDVSPKVYGLNLVSLKDAKSAPPEPQVFQVPKNKIKKVLALYDEFMKHPDMVTSKWELWALLHNLFPAMKVEGKYMVNINPGRWIRVIEAQE